MEGANPVTYMYILSNNTSSSIIPISIAYVYFVHCNLLLLLTASLTNFKLFHITLTVDNHLFIHVCTSLWLAHAWFLEIAFTHNVSMYVAMCVWLCVFVCRCLRVCVCLCVCVCVCVC